MTHFGPDWRPTIHYHLMPFSVSPVSCRLLLSGSYTDAPSFLLWMTSVCLTYHNIPSRALPSNSDAHCDCLCSVNLCLSLEFRDKLLLSWKSFSDFPPWLLYLSVCHQDRMYRNLLIFLVPFIYLAIMLVTVPATLLKGRGGALIFLFQLLSQEIVIVCPWKAGGENKWNISYLDLEEHLRKGWN